MAETPRCRRVTGKTFKPHYWQLPRTRQGPRRPVDESPGYDRWVPRPPQPVWDVLCGEVADYEIHYVDKDLHEAKAYSCNSCLTAVVDQCGGNVTIVTLKQCRQVDEFGGKCVYRLNHAIQNHRFEGGNTQARHQAALAAYKAEKAEKGA